jgi:hypothetical protein
MNYIPFWILAIPFLYFNYKIIKNDLIYKTIPNKYLIYLIYLLPLFFISIFYFLNWVVNNYIVFFWQIFFSIFICFLLYYFWFWWAWDAKYLLVLSFFLSHIWFFHFIWNIGILILLYLLWYFFYFYLWKCLINKNYAKSLYNNIYTDLRDKFFIFIKHNDWNIYKSTAFKIIINWLLIFLFFFVWFRLIRLIFINNLLLNNNIPDFWKYIIRYQMYIWFFVFSFFRIMIYVMKKILTLFKNKFNITLDKTKLLMPILLFIILLLFIYVEYVNNPYQITKYLYKIFTFYIYLYLFFRILIYSYKLTFQISETQYININELKEWTIIDKDYLIKMYWEQKCLSNINEKCISYSNPKQYFLKLSNPIDTDTVIILKDIYYKVNNYHIENKTANYEKNNKIKILMTFAFAPYIFSWFLLTFFFQSKIFDFINNLLLEFIKNIYN